MTLLHDYFHLRDYQAFQRLLYGTSDHGQTSNGGKSWSKSSPLAAEPTTCDINTRDGFGRTVLHLACASLDTLGFFKLLLRHPAINVNVTDNESGWTPLHRALYNTNLHAAIVLLQRSDTDRYIQDFEGYTAFDLYNSTLNKTKPERGGFSAELYMWGANRNATLGFPDGNDRAHPDQILLPNQDNWTERGGPKLISQFLPVHIRQLQMSKLHTAVVTSESSGNLRLCGFGNGGRLGPGQHTQYSLKPLQNFQHTVISVALGQDHTLALTKSGEVLSWGLNRFSQLGYVLEGLASGENFARTEEPIQPTPRKVQGALKKETVQGVAASKGASACWTDMDVYTWGTHYGQLGYDRAGQTVQILPRKATKVPQPVVAISISDSAMACLLVSRDLVCIWNDRAVKIIFPAHGFPSEMQPYRPPQAVRDAKISKITSCDNVFAALSLSGELFTLSIPNSSDAGVVLAKDKAELKPQRVWALRKKSSSVKDVALGSDGSIVVCTESGHVFVRSHSLKGRQASGKPSKFQRLPAFQRVTQVCSNSAGAFGALRVEYQMQPIEICGNTFSQDIAKIQPFLHVWWTQETLHEEPKHKSQYSPTFDDDGSDNRLVRMDIDRLQHILNILALQSNAIKDLGGSARQGGAYPVFKFGADVMIEVVPGYVFLAHRVILGARSRVFNAILSGSTHQKKVSSITMRRLEQNLLVHNLPGKGRHVLEVSGCKPLSFLILLTFLYTDDVLAPWDHRVATALGQLPEGLEVNLTEVRMDLQALAKLLELSDLSVALESLVKPSPTPTLEDDMRSLLHSRTLDGFGPIPALIPDVILQLCDQDIHCHSAILRARSEFFADFLDEEEWTKKRWNANGVLIVDMKHLEWRVMDYVLRFMCYGAEDEMFVSLDRVNNADDVLDFMFDVMAAANEILLDRLVLLCSKVILQYVNIHNALSILSEATFLHAQQLTNRVQSFITVNMEVFLETGMLDDIPTALLTQLAEFIKTKQVEKNPVSRSNRLVDEALTKHVDWLALQDIPTPIVRVNPSTIRKDSPNFKITPIGLGKSPQQSSSMQSDRTIRRPLSNDDLFIVDDHELPPLFSADRSQVSVAKRTSATSLAGHSEPTPVWKASSAPRVDMKAVMAEAASAAVPSRRPPDKLQQPISSTSSTKTGSVSRSIPIGRKVPIEQTEIRSSPPVTPFKESAVYSSSTWNLSVTRRPSGPTPSGPGIGPVITPARQASSSSTTLRRTSGKAWTQPPAKTPTGLEQSAKSMSFAAIQQSQSEGISSSTKDKRSLREIQEEEQALQAEADFLVWWTAEEERVKREMQIAQAQDESIDQPGQKRRIAPRRRRGNEKVDQRQPQGQGQGQGQAKSHRRSQTENSESQTMRQRSENLKPRHKARKPSPGTNAAPAAA